MSSPPSTTTTTPSTPSSESLSDSSHSSPDSFASDSPLVSFHSTDSRSFPASHSPLAVDSHPTGSLFSPIPSSVHVIKEGDWPSSVAVQPKDTSDSIWHHPELSLFSLDDITASNAMDFSMGFDSMLFSNDALFSAAPATSGGGVVNPSIDLSFSFGFPETNKHVALQGDTADDERSGISSSSAGVSPVPGMEPTQMSGSSSSDILATSSIVPPTDSIRSQSSNDQLVDGLVAQAKQLVGLTMALPFGESPVHPEQKQDLQQVASLALSLSNTLPPISGLSTPQGTSSPFPTPAPTTTRTKTSHTTIERRYRTNLNARIQSLRAAVPALRVLEVKQGNRVGNLPLKAGTRRVGVDPDAQPGQEDVIDERGYIDGVKVARKGSKANVLGKAVEYIHVLKRREMRLKREQEGLKALIRSLVGGPELVQQWERMWRERFGGPEKDEIEADDVDDDNDDGEDDDEADSREVDAPGPVSGRKRKRVMADLAFSGSAKEMKLGVSSAQGAQSIPIIPSLSRSTSLPSPAPAQPEKRKRGRPRKVPNPPLVPFNDVQASIVRQDHAAVPTANDPLMEPNPVVNVQRRLEAPLQSRTTSNQPYLLAVFAFFSFFNSPFKYPSTSWTTTHSAAHHYKHAGSVLAGSQSEILHDGRDSNSLAHPYDWHDVLQISHLTVSLLLLLSIVGPWIPKLVHRRPRALKPVLSTRLMLNRPDVIRASSSASESSYASEEGKTDTAIRLQLSSALSGGRLLPFDKELEMLRGVLWFGKGILGSLVLLSRQLVSRSKSHSRHSLERQLLEQKAFLRVAELAAMDERAPITTRIRIYVHSFKYLSLFPAHAKDIATLALVIRPVWHARSVSLWRLALSRAQEKIANNLNVCRSYESFVLENMDADEAAVTLRALHPQPTIARFADKTPTSLSEDDDRIDLASPLAVLARRAVHDFVRKYAERAFLQCVSGDDGSGEQTIGSGEETCQREISRVVSAGRSLGARTAKIVDTFESLFGLGSAPSVTVSHWDPRDVELECSCPSGGPTDVDDELFALLRAVSLYRRIFSTSADALGTRCCVACGDGVRNLPSPMLSPPPSPSRRDAALCLTLRRCLDSPAFDRNDALEDARDCVVDMLTTENIR